ncbi:glycosyltransferase family 9 protein [Paludibacterium yongneupense]|uniref:glycosyltransferase family 9 protein n=1 Tax=Paludibacterium yongneupense TaxID=400061 RepID=UPI0003FAE14A|nr:glycosyltransferase family 9 protein [Paludibacterium yongneupense]
MIATLYLTVETLSELEELFASPRLALPPQVQALLLCNRELGWGARAGSLPPGFDAVTMCTFVNGLPQVRRSDLDSARGEWVAFCGLRSRPLDSAWPALASSTTADWQVFDAEWGDAGFVPQRLARCRADADAYRNDTVSTLDDWARTLAGSAEPDWFLADSPMLWLRRGWLRAALHDEPLPLANAVHRGVLSALQRGGGVEIAYLPQPGCVSVDWTALPDAALLPALQRDLVQWVGLLLAEYAGLDEVEAVLAAFVRQDRPWLASDRARPGSPLAALANAFRQNYPAYRPVRELLRAGGRWVVAREEKIDAVQVVARDQAASWAAGDSRLAAIRREAVRFDRFVVSDAYDLMLQSPDGQLAQWMALYRQPDGRWVWPALCEVWPDAELDRVSDMLDAVAAQVAPGQTVVADESLAATVTALSDGRFLPGFEGYSTLVQHAARYRLASRLGTLGRVLDCASGAGYGWHLLHDGGTMSDYTGIDLNAAAIGFSRRFIPPGAPACRFEARLLDTLDKAAFDTVISFETIEHVDDPEIFLWDLAERIAPGGRLLLSLPAERWAGTHLNPSHWSNWNEARVRALCARVFESVELIRLRLSLIAPETFVSGRLHGGRAVTGEDEGFLLRLQGPRPRRLSQRVLVQRRFAMGDALLASSVLPALRRKYPEQVLVVRTQVVEAFFGHPDIDLLGGMQIARRDDDIFIDLDQAYERRREAHIVEAYADVASVAPGQAQLMRLPQDYRPIAREFAARGWLTASIPQHIVAVHLAATSPDRIWPLAQWRELIAALLARGDCAIVLLGHGRDLDLDSLPGVEARVAVSLVRRVSLAETAAALAVADLLIAPDSGLIHVAAAVGTSVLGLFGMAEPAQRLPQNGASVGLIADIECRGCLKQLAPLAAPVCRLGHAKCMEEIATADVTRAAEILLAGTPARAWRDRLLTALPLPLDRDGNKSWRNAAPALPAASVRLEAEREAVPIIAASQVAATVPVQAAAPRAVLPSWLGRRDGARVRLGILSFDPADSACGRLRVIDPFSLLTPWVETSIFPGITLRAFNEHSSDLTTFLGWADVFLVQRAMLNERTRSLWQPVLDSGKPVLFEVDDWLPALPAAHPQFEDYTPTELKVCWQRHLPKMSRLIASTEHLAATMRPWNDRVQVIPNLLARQRWQDYPLADNGDEPVTIAFCGTATHNGDLRLISDALLRIVNTFGSQVRFLFWGGSLPHGFEQVQNVTLVPKTVDYQDYLAHLSTLKIDIGIAPLEENPFNDGKSDLKWLEYSAVGAACVASDVPAYAEAKRLGLALVVNNDRESWEQALASLIRDKALRHDLATRARAHLAGERALESQVRRWIDALRAVLPAAVASRLEGFNADALGALVPTPLQWTTQKALKAWQGWTALHSLREIDAQMMAERMMKEWTLQPRFNLIMAVRAGERERLSETVSALAQQLYPHWQLTVLADWDPPPGLMPVGEHWNWRRVETLDASERIAGLLNSTLAELPCDWMMWLPAGARPAPHALLRIGDAIHASPGALAVYSDHDLCAGEACFDPCFKPDFSLDYLRAYDYVGAAVAMSLEGVAALGGFAVYPGAEVWNHLLSLPEHFSLGVVAHVDDILFHLPAASGGNAAERLAARQVALENHLARLQIAARVGPGYAADTLHIDYQVVGQPLVSVIVPTRDKLEFLQPCIDSLFAKTDYPAFELLLVDNGSTDPDTLAYYDELTSEYGERVRILPYAAPFNFSAQCNLGVEAARGEYILLLNNDTEVIQSKWMERMLAIAQRPEVGAVGARLVYPETGRIQHAGIVLGLPGGVLSVADHVFETALLDEPGYMKRLQTEQNYSAVTAACLMVARSKYLGVDGFDATGLTVLFNDVDFCLKLQQSGLINVYSPYATLVHHHAKSIGKVTFEATVAFEAAVRERRELECMVDRWLPQLARDPAYNRHLSLRNREMAYEPQFVVPWTPEVGDRPKVLGLPIPGGSGEYRVVRPFHALQQAARLDTVTIAPVHRLIPVLSVVEMQRMRPDVLLIHSVLTEGIQHGMEQYRRFLPDLPLVFGLDDLVGAIPEKSVLSRIWRKSMPDARTRLRKALKLCDRLIVSTQPLADFCADMIGDIHVVPNRLPKEMWDQLESKRRRGDKPRVGWVGAQQHQGDLALIVDVVKATADEVDWVFMGMCLPELLPYVKEEYPCVLFKDYPGKMAALDLDLAIAPLEMNPFNEAKSNLRLLEYGAMGWPVVCSDVYPYRSDNAPVCRVPNTTAAWVEAIRERVHDLDAAAREGDALREWVRHGYFLEDHLDDWERALTGFRPR